MQKKIHDVRVHFEKDLASAQSSKEVEQLMIKYLGKKGLLQELMEALRGVSAQDKPILGKEINDLKHSLSSCLEQAKNSFSIVERNQKIEAEKLDVTLPGRRLAMGRAHPLYALREEMLALLRDMGFSVQCGPDIDSDYYNYEGMNFPPDHPARDMQDTFYISPDLLLRSHTSNVQLRVLESHKPPIRIVAPGTVYRNETISARSHVFFHQIEGLYVAEEVSFADLFSTLELFFGRLFRRSVELRFRPSYFPFVEPGVEVDIRCTACEGSGCRLCKHTGFLEVAGAGMVHPEVLKNGGMDPEKYSGYAWGMGIERLAMLLYGVKDIRLFAENDLRFLQQF